MINEDKKAFRSSQTETQPKTNEMEQPKAIICVRKRKEYSGKVQ